MLNRAFRPRPLQLPLTIPPDARLAQISDGPHFANARLFVRPQWSALPAFEPDLLIGYGLDLARLASSIERGELAAVAVKRLAFALTDCGTPVASQQLRDDLWRAFRVPLFEAIVAPGSRLLAAECEAHCGWHVQSGLQIALHEGELVYYTPSKLKVHTGLAGALEALPCPCGRPTPRVLRLYPYLRKCAAQNGNLANPVMTPLEPVLAVAG